MRPDRPDRSRETPRRLRPSGGYRSAASFQTTTLIYDATYFPCEKFLDPLLQFARNLRRQRTAAETKM